MLFMMSLTAGAASPRVMTYADFVHLSDAQKDEYIIKLMELTVELESRYKKETAKYGYSQERFERYTKILRTLKSIFWIDSAYALNTSHPGKNADMSWTKLAQNFNTLMNYQRSTAQGKLDDNCIFAGWVSRVVYIKDAAGVPKPTCAHPDFIDGIGPDRHKTKMAPESKGYPYPDKAKGSSCSKDDKMMIQCNPVIFGYKSVSSKSLFCVEARDGAKNSSFNCMQLALKETGEAGIDSKQVRLKDLRDRLADPANKDVFKQVWEFTYKTCVCPTVVATTQNTKMFSQDYQNHIRPHRTCYGLMDMMGATALECTDVEAKPFPSSDTKIFADLRERIKRESVTESQADTEYANYLKDMLDKNNPDYLRLCSLAPTETPKTYSCKADCTADAADANKLTCDYKISDGSETAPELDGTPTGPEPKRDAPQVDVKFKLKGSAEEKTVKCDLTFPTVAENPKTYTCTSTCRSLTAGKTEDDTIAGDQKTGFACTYAIKEGENSPELEGEPTGPAEIPALGGQVDVKFKLKGTSEEKTVKCDVKDAEEPKDNTTDNTKPSLDTTKTCDTANCTIKAVYDKTKATGWTLSWDFKTPPEGGQVPKGWEAASTTDARLTAPSDASSNVAATAPDEVKQKRVAKPYDVCATLTKGTEKVGPSCKTVDPLAAATAPAAKDAPKPALNYNQNGQPQLPQAPIRGSSDTSAVGIK